MCDIFSILEKTLYYSNSNKFFNHLSEEVIANIFFENSTRTHYSFELAAKKLGAIVLNFNTNSSSMNKGESIEDTLKTFEALGVTIAIIRHSSDDLLTKLLNKFQFNIINAGSGKSEHPSQALLDVYTIKEHFKEVSGLNICICGDIAHSRVAFSNIKLLQLLGANVYISGPSEYIPNNIDTLNTPYINIDQACKECDVLMLLRVQKERHKNHQISKDHYNKNFGLNLKRVKEMRQDAIFLHPGPFNRSVEITDDIIEHKKSKIFQQVKNGVYLRMGILEWIKESR